MKKLLSIKYSANAFNAALLLLRIGVGVTMMSHGYDKLVHFGKMQNEFMNFMGIGQTASLALVVFAEFFCSLFLILGLFTRLATIPLIITMAVALVKVHHNEFLGEGQAAALFLIGYLVILLVGPGKASVDGLTGK